MKSYTQFKNITLAAVIGFGLFGLPGMMTPAAAVVMFSTITTVSVSSFTIPAGQEETGTATVNGSCSPLVCTIDLTGNVQFKLDGADLYRVPLIRTRAPIGAIRGT